MSERFELSFKNKEVRMWFYFAVPTFVIGSIFIFFIEQKYQYIPLFVLVIAWTSFFLWRFFYRKKNRGKEKSPF